MIREKSCLILTMYQSALSFLISFCLCLSHGTLAAIAYSQWRLMVDKPCYHNSRVTVFESYHHTVV